nr:probable plastid-lipid-associated protein 10, chloroplastic isoform X1 [Spinacia oleracea]
MLYQLNSRILVCFIHSMITLYYRFSSKSMAFVMAPLTITPAYKIVHNGRTSQVTIPSAVRMPRNLPNTTYWRCSATATDTSLLYEVENRKHDLLRAVQETERGLKTTPEQRSSIEEALVTVEKYDAGEPIDLAKLDGTWRLQYTSAPDVVVLFEAASRLPIFQVGQIFQKFECRNESDGGVVRNIIKWGIQNLLEDNEGATLLVSAKFSVVSRRNIFLQFEEITLQDIVISEQLQAVIAPALLPRTFLSLQILQFIRSFKAQIPVTSTSPQRRSIGGLYYLSYMDNNMLVGRAVGGGGIFVFTRAQPFVC